MSASSTAKIRTATLEDLPLLLSLARRFVSESSLPLTFDRAMSEVTLRHAIENDYFIALVEEDEEGVISGGILGAVYRDFCVEPCAYVNKMYVEKAFRGLGTARALIEEFQAEAKRRGASIVFASATAGMGDRTEKLYVQLFSRYGYKILGRVLVKEI